MKNILFVILSLLVSFNLEAGEDIKKNLEEMFKSSEHYTGELDELTKPSKAAIVEGKLDIAIKPYLSVLETKLGREKMGDFALYQIFLIYTDPSNSKRDPALAKKYLDRLINDYPDSENSKKAQKLHKKYN